MCDLFLPLILVLSFSLSFSPFILLGSLSLESLHHQLVKQIHPSWLQQLRKGHLHSECPVYKRPRQQMEGEEAAGSWRRLGGEDDLSGNLGERKHTARELSHAERWWVPRTPTILGFCLIPWAGWALRPRVWKCYPIS